MYRVETFAHARTYYAKMRPLEDELHLVPTATLAVQLKKVVNEHQVWTYSELVRLLFPEWHHPLTEVYLSSRLRHWIEQMAPDPMVDKLQAHIPELLNSFQYLVSMSPLSLREDLAPTDESRVVARIFTALSRDDVVLRYLHQQRMWSKNSLRSRLRLPKLETFVVHQFDYLDVSRMMFFYRLRQMGFQVVFRIPYEQRWSTLYRGWKAIYETLSMRPDTSWRVLDNSASSQGQKLACYLDGVTGGHLDPLSIQFVHFHHPIHFKSFVKRHENTCFVTVEEEDVRRCVDFRNTFLSAPWLRLITALSKCRRQEETIFLDYDTFVALVLSGWFDTPGLRIYDALSLLCDLRGYMDGVRTFDDIIERLQTLADLQAFSHVFDQQAKDQTQRHLAKQYLANPFRAFSYVHSSRYKMTVKQLLEWTRGMERKLKGLLYPPKERVSVHAYVNQLRKLFEQVKSNWPPEVVQAVDAVLAQSVPNDWFFEMPDLLRLLEVLWNRGDEETVDIYPLSMVNGLALREQELHLTDMSMNVFPQRTQRVPAYFDYTWLKQCILQSDVVKNKPLYLHALLVDYRSRERVKEQSVYNLYYLLANCNGRLTVSWIEFLRKADTPSMYYHILLQLYGHGEPVKYPQGSEEAIQTDSLDMITDVVQAAAAALDVGPQDIFDWNVFEKLREIPELYWLDMDFCARKFFLNAFVQHQPVYEHDFHQRLAFGIIGKYFTQLPHVKEEYMEEVFPLFPQWTPTLKTNLIDTEFSRPVRDYKKFENMYYPKAMQALQVLRSRYLVTRRWKVKHRYQKGTFQLKSEMVREWFKYFRVHDVQAEKGSHCRMCPHLYVCVEGEFAADVHDD